MTPTNRNSKQRQHSGANSTPTATVSPSPTATPRRTPIPSGLIINSSYDPDATFTAAGLSVQDIRHFQIQKAANAYALPQFTSNFNDPINVNIHADLRRRHWKRPMSNTSIGSVTYANIEPRSSRTRPPRTTRRRSAPVKSSSGGSDWWKPATYFEPGAGHKALWVLP